MLQYGVRFADGYSVLLLSGQKLFGIDAFGLGVILFLLLLFGIPYTRYFLRRADIPERPIISPRVEKTEALPRPRPDANPRHCHATHSVSLPRLPSRRLAV